jgi:hypothetical protein
MKNFLLISLGVVAGFVIAHEVSKTESGKAFLANVDSAVEGVKEAVVTATARATLRFARASNP